MKARRRPVISSKKQPTQDRAKQLVADILEAAVQVLREQGARRFTTVRVAAAAGCSIGSLYQYFPNKESLLFRMQVDEWAETGAILGELLSDRRRPPLDRLRRAIAMFFRSERDESDFRGALDDAGALIRDAPEAQAHRRAVTEKMLAFMADALPDVAPKRRAFAADFVLTSISAIAEQITKEPLSRAACDAWAAATADCMCGYLEQLQRGAVA